MVYTLVLNQSNVVSTDNNQLVYNFPNSVSFPNHEIAVQSVAMYYSWQNVNANPLLNNTFTYQWVVAGVPTTFTVTIPDGTWEVTDINNYLQYTFIQNGHYLINAAGQNVYYGELIINANRYAVQLNTFPVPTALPVGWSVPVANPATGAAGWGGFPAATFNPAFTFPANFNLLIGFAASFSSSLNTGVGTNLSYLSTTAPQVQPNPSAYLSISNIENGYAIPNSIIYAITPNVAFGEQIREFPPQFAWNRLIKGTYNQLRITVLGVNKQPLRLQDPNMTIVLVIRDTKEVSDLITLASGGK